MHSTVDNRQMFDALEAEKRDGAGLAGMPGSRKKKRLSAKEINFMRGYYCCLAALLRSHGDNTYIGELLHCAGSDEEILRYADSGDIEILQQDGYLLSENAEVSDGLSQRPESE